MDSDISTIIRKYSCRADDASYNFISTNGIKANFGVNTEKMPNFLSDYCKMAEEDENNSEDDSSGKRKYNLGICEELVRKAAPIVSVHFFKFNIKKEDMEGEDIIKKEFVLALVYSYQQVISETFNISVDTKELTAAVLETPVWFTKKVACFKIELRFPHCHFDKSYQKKQFKINIIDKLRENHVLSFLDMQPIGDWDQIIEDNGDYLPLYRSVTDSSVPPSSLTMIMGAMRNSKDLDAEKDLSDVFEPNDHSYIHGGEISPDFLEEYKDVNHWIPLFLSAFFWNKPVTLKDGDKEKKSHSSNYDDEYDEDESDELLLARRFLEMIEPDTISQNNYWTDIGKVLYKLSWGSDEGLEAFVDVSSKCKSENRSKKACKEIWPKFKNSSLTVKTLAWMARTDNKVDYDVWHSKWVGIAMEDALTDMTDLDLANVIYRFFWLDFTCSDMSSNRWWYFTSDTHRHVPMDGAFKLRKDISNKLVPLLINFRADIAKKQVGLGGNQSRRAKVEEKELENKLARITKLITKFKSTAPRNKAIEMSKENFYIENFHKLINKDPNKTAWSNCVIELNNGKVVIRNGKPEDFITKAGLVPYRSDFSYEHPVVKELLEYLGKVFVDEEMCEYFKKDASSYLYGKNAEKYFRVWTGIKGNNSKSMMVKLMQLWWGELCVDIPLSVYVGKTKFKGSGPNPEIAQMDSAHLGITAEPDEDGDLGAGAIKRSSGGDSQFGRGCNVNGGSITMTHKAIFMCNGVPNIPGVDEPTKDRVAFLLFLSKWVKNPPKDIKEQYKKRLFAMDVNFEQRLPELAEAMFWLSVEYYPKYFEEGLIAPKMVEEYAKLHWEDNDPFQSFIAERMQKVKIKEGENIGISNSVVASDIYPQFKIFFKTNNPQSTMPTSSQFKTQMTQRLGDQDGKRWPGWIIRDDV